MAQPLGLHRVGRLLIAFHPTLELIEVPLGQSLISRPVADSLRDGVHGVSARGFEIFWAVFRVHGAEIFIGKLGRGQGPKILNVERVDAIAIRLLRAAQVNRVMNPTSSPTIDGTAAN